MSQDTTTLIPIPFHGDTITCVETPDGEFVAVKPICERLGLSDRAQRKRLNADPDLWGGTVMVLPSAGGTQETFVIPRSRMAAWLFTIEVRRVKPELREALTLYRREAADVLDRHFRRRQAHTALELSELQARLEICQQHLLASVPHWAQIQAAWRIGALNDAVMARRLRMSRSRFAVERQCMEDCGLIAPGWAPDMKPDTLLARLRELEFQLKLAGRWDAVRNQPLAEPDLFGHA